ncbi:ABC transporter permease [Desulfofustis glycolicus]|uniref:NitT/TauT family transport system permease protein n=1 Tax=Desulfofustis glycolicus DSM 9705 TaxID=1121409 RepID=A0A1M5Y6G6_9BACT|nr:ABC transporter permease [Desulfofustis glycolicus]SHI07681.1 NitT/TauT family transport system permease protein [Desulfofustis glycolicus DSM 9705]
MTGTKRNAFFHPERWVTVVFFGFCLLVWEVAAQSTWISTLFFPAPSTIVKTLTAMTGTGLFWLTLGTTLYRLLLGVVAGAGAGLVVGWGMGASRKARAVLDPVVAALHPMPKLAIFPIFLVILGIGEASKIALIALAAFFPMLLNTLAGVQHIEQCYWEAASNYGARGMTLLRRVIMPGSLPMAMTGLRLAFNNALVVTIAIEMLSAQDGLGAQIWMSWQTLRTEELYATLIVIGVVGMLSNAVLGRLVVWLLPWHTKA